jgi:cytochrome c peroxidase
MKIIRLCVSLLSVAASQAWSVVPSVATQRSTKFLAQLSTQSLTKPNDGATTNSRRAFLLTAPTATAAAAAALSSLTFVNIAGASDSSVNYKDVAADIAALVKGDPDKGPTLVRLAWHSSGTYDKMSKDGGSGGGTIRFKEELAHGGNAGLGETAVKWMEPIHAKYAKQGLSYADLYTLGGGTYTLNSEHQYSRH